MLDDMKGKKTTALTGADFHASQSQDSAAQSGAGVRLQKILAQAGIASRRKAEELIRSGLVRVDGEVITDLGRRVDPERQVIAVNGAPLKQLEPKVYLLLNKPRGFLSTLSDPQGRPIVTDMTREVLARVFPVGRLDLDSEGALLLTNDGDFAQRVQHPSYGVNKTYEARVLGHPAPAVLAQLEQGLEIDGKLTWPAQVKVLRKSHLDTLVEIIIHEGRKRQVRKMFAALGHPVVRLRRTAYGALKLGRLPKGNYRILKAKDVALIFTKKEK